MGTIQILKNRSGKYYVRVKHDNGRILCHCQAVGSRVDAGFIAMWLSEGKIIWCIAIAKNNQHYFCTDIGFPGEFQRTFFSETYSSRQKAEQGLNAVIRICKAGRIEDLTGE